MGPAMAEINSVHSACLRGANRWPRRGSIQSFSIAARPAPASRVSPPPTVLLSKPIILVALPLLLCAAGLSVQAADGADTPASIERVYRSGQPALAFQRVDKAIAAQPQDPGLRFLRAVMLGDSRREPEARAEYEKLTQDFPELPEPFNNLAVMQAAQGRLDHARDLLETAIRNDPTYHTAHANLGDVYARLALRSYTSAASTPRVDDGLAHKLRMARELVAAPSSQP